MARLAVILLIGMKEPALNTTPLSAPPGLVDIFFTWLSMGIQSFGGGSSTFYLMHQNCIKRGWLDEERFVRTWALAQVAPGINLLKLTMMIGYRLRGWPGLIAASAGLMLPSAGVTVLMTAGFSAIRGQPVVQAALRGVLPATIGLSLAMAIQMARPQLTRAHREGRPRLAAHIAILVSAALLMGLGGVSPALVLLISGAAGVLLLALLPGKPGAAAPAPKLLSIDEPLEAGTPVDETAEQKETA